MFLDNFVGTVESKIMAFSYFLFIGNNLALPFVLCVRREIFLLRVLTLRSYATLLRITFSIWILVFGTYFLEGSWAVSFLAYNLLLLLAEEEYIIYGGKGWFFVTGKDGRLLPCGRRLLDKLLRWRASRNGANGIRIVGNGAPLTARMHVASSLPPLALGEAESPSVYQFHTYKLLQSFEVLIVQLYIIVASTLSEKKTRDIRYSCVKIYI